MKATLKITSLFFCLFFLSTNLGFARPGMNQPPGIKPMWWHNQQLCEDLKITAEQEAKLEEQLQASHPKMIDMKAEVDKALFALEGALGKNFNEQEAAAKIQDYLYVQNTIMQARIENLLNTRKILTFEQFKKLRDKSKRFRKNRQHYSKGESGRPEQRKRK